VVSVELDVGKKLVNYKLAFMSGAASAAEPAPVSVSTRNTSEDVDAGRSLVTIVVSVVVAELGLQVDELLR